MLLRFPEASEDWVTVWPLPRSKLRCKRPLSCFRRPERRTCQARSPQRATYFIDFRRRIKLCCLRDVSLVFQRRQELQKGKQSLPMARAGTLPVKGTTTASVVPQGLNSRVPTWTPWLTDTPVDLGSPSTVLLSSPVKGLSVAAFPAAPAGLVQLHYSPS